MTENDTTVEETLQLVSFSLGSEEFGIDILSVQEINRVSSITRVPNAPKYVVGVINLRGKIIPVVDLRKRFSMPSIATTEHSRIIVVELDTRVVG
ncbi:MAG: chemotaxis protein CheW, partial [Candidatus Kapabacteria bacterium]|nr:chemotaxis protein CheW [Candidatus Kapabacteria bacterium]